MFSLNVPLSPIEERLTSDLHPKRSGFNHVRDRHTLVCKRFGTDAVAGDSDESAHTDHPSRSVALDRLCDRLRRPLARTSPFEVAVTGVDTFDVPASGSSPVVYLTVESDGLVRLHRRLCADFDAIEGIEGDDYVPHITLARGGNPDSGVVVDLVDTAFDPIRWRVHALDVWDPEVREVAVTVDV